MTTTNTPACRGCGKRISRYAAKHGGMCFACQQEADPPTWFSRWRRYPGSIIGHIGQGLICGAAAATPYWPPAAVWAAAYLAYQFGSGARKWAAVGHPDTMGLDTVDFAVGFAFGYAAAAICRHKPLPLL